MSHSTADLFAGSFFTSKATETLNLKALSCVCSANQDQRVVSINFWHFTSSFSEPCAHGSKPTWVASGRLICAPHLLAAPFSGTCACRPLPVCCFKASALAFPETLALAMALSEGLALAFPSALAFPEAISDYASLLCTGIARRQNIDATEATTTNY